MTRCTGRTGKARIVLVTMHDLFLVAVPRTTELLLCSEMETEPGIAVFSTFKDLLRDLKV